MRTVLPLIHLMFASLWLGCVLTEGLFERALVGAGRDNELRLARLHWQVDALVEIPAFLGVLVTGLMLATQRTGFDALLLAKVTLGIMAIGANAWCVGLVRRRLQQASAGDWTGFARTDHRQHQWGAVVLAGLAGALLLGLYRAA